MKSKKRIKRKRISLGRKILYSGFAVFFLFAFLEVSFRLLGAKPFPKTPYADSPYEMEWELKPNFNDVWSDVAVRINSMGFRDSEITVDKKPNEYRAIFLGDSVVFGYKLRQNETIPELLEYCLNQEFPHKHFEVINAGVDGYSTFQELYLLKRKGLKLKPDLVILGYVLNDVFEHYRTTARYGGAGKYVNAGKKSFSRTVMRLCYKSAFFTSLHYAHLKFKAKRREKLQTLGKWRYRSRESVYNIAEIFKDDYSPEIEQAWEDALEQLLHLQVLTNENNIPLLVMLFPYAYQLEPTESAIKPQSILIPFCKKHEIALYDLLPEFLNHPEPESLFLDGNHFNRQGCELIAGSLCEKLSKDQILFERGKEFGHYFLRDTSIFNYDIRDTSKSHEEKEVDDSE